MKRLLTILLALCLCLAAAACGGDSKEDTTAAEEAAESEAPEETEEATKAETEAPATEAATEASAALTGTWVTDPTSGGVGQGESYTLELREDGTFTMTAEFSSTSHSAEGTYEMEGSQLTLYPSTVDGQASEDPEGQREEGSLDGDGRLVFEDDGLIFVPEDAASQEPAETAASITDLAGSWKMDPACQETSGMDAASLVIEADGTFTITLEAGGETQSTSGSCTVDGSQIVLTSQDTGVSEEGVLDAQGRLQMEDGDLIFVRE